MLIDRGIGVNMSKILKRIFTLLIILTVVIALFINISVSAIENSNYTSSENSIEELYNWLINSQLDNGALPVYAKEAGEVSVNPYFSSIATLAILRHGDGLQTAEKYYNWHFERLNEDGSIYDYEAVIENKKIVSENSKADYDSADSYAALFLVSLWEYIEAGGSTEYILGNKDKIYLIIHLMTSLIDEDGLSTVSYDNGTKYLMDNCEVYAGLNSASHILEKVMLRQHGMFSKEYWNIRKQIMSLKLLAYKMKAAIEIYLWNNERGCYDVGISSNGNAIQADECNDFYPDAVAQLFPIVFDLINPRGQRAQYIYDKFSKEFEWQSLSHYYDNKSSFYWGIITFCGSIMGDKDKVEQYIRALYNAEAPDYNYPLYNADAAWVILAWKNLD